MGNEDVQKNFLFNFLKDKKMLEISKPVLTEIFKNKNWQHQHDKGKIDNSIAHGTLEQIQRITKMILSFSNSPNKKD